MSYFPMFVELKNKPCLVVGGGRVAFHKVRVLLEFEARVTVAAPYILPEIVRTQGVVCRNKPFDETDLIGQELVVAATDDEAVNRNVSAACRSRRIPVNVADRPKECSFIFPAYLKEGEVVAAFSSGGKSPVVTQYLKEQARPIVTEQIGKMADCLGDIRKTVQHSTKTLEAAKRIYQELLRLGLETGRVPTEQEIAEILRSTAEP